LDAIRYAHARGILHRDLKPANVQIGPYGEVTVMDWGIAKPFSTESGAQPTLPLDQTLVQSHDQRLLQTQLGALAGTPLYMSPEQAAGHNDSLDQRSDIYALCLMLYEWLVLEHPRTGKTTITEVIAATISEDYGLADLFNRGAAVDVPMDYVWVVVNGLKRDRSDRYASVEAMEAEIQRILDGRIPIRCHVTLGKSAARGVANWIDRHTTLYTIGLGLFLLTLLGSIVALIAYLVRTSL
jgi:serine/threonine-protein kinase